MFFSLTHRYTTDIYIYIHTQRHTCIHMHTHVHNIYMNTHIYITYTHKHVCGVFAKTA